MSIILINDRRGLGVSACTSKGGGCEFDSRSGHVWMSVSGFDIIVYVCSLSQMGSDRTTCDNFQPLCCTSNDLDYNVCCQLFSEVLLLVVQPHGKKNRHLVCKHLRCRSVMRPPAWKWENYPLGYHLKSNFWIKSVNSIIYIYIYR